MKVYIITLIVISLIFTCKVNGQSSLRHRNFVFTVEFYPSFTVPCRITLQKKGKLKVLSIDNIYGNKRIKISDKKDLQIEKKENLLIDQWFYKFYGDTIFIRNLEIVYLTEENFHVFQNNLSNINLAKQQSLVKEGILDGITIYFKFKTNTTDNRFSFRCPVPSDTAAFQMIKALFSMLESSTKTEVSNNYIEQLKGYFNFGLLVKHISDNPLEYRFYSHLSSSEADELYSLIKGLPNDKPIIFDFSNFGGMGTMFYPTFQNLIQRNPNIYWIVNDYSQRQMLEIGVNPERLFRERQSLMKKVKNEP